MFLVGQGDTKRCAKMWSRDVKFFGVLPCLSFQLLATPQGACSAQKRPAKDASKIAVHLANPWGRTWTARDQFSAPFAVVKIFKSQGTQRLNPVSKFGTMMTGIFLRKWLSFESWKSFESLGCVVNPLGRTEPQTKKGAIRTAWRMKATIDPLTKKSI